MGEKYALKIEERTGCLWITLPDAITMHNNKEIEQKIGDILHDRKEEVVLDFTNTQTVYSSGLGLMIRIRRFVTERGGTLSLVNVTDAVYDMFVALNINKVFPIYTTDVEFEISQTNFIEKENRLSRGLLLISKIENECYRINFSGDMTQSSDFSPFYKFDPSPIISLYIIDMGGLEIIDNVGAEEFINFTKRIAAAGGICRVFGLSDVNISLITVLGATKYMTFYADEKTAFNG